MTMRYHWGDAVGHLYTHHASSRQNVAPISTNPELEGLRHYLDTVEQGPDGGNGSPDSDEGGNPDPMSTNPELEVLRHGLDTVEQGADGSHGSLDKDEGEIPDTVSDVHDWDHWDHKDMDHEGMDHEGRDHWDAEGSDENCEHYSDSDSQHNSDTESILLEIDAMYGDTLDVEWTSFD